MYSPDGFASLACALHGQCSFLAWQTPFVYLIRLFNNPVLFFGLQALLWFVLIGLIYFLAKELEIKHLFLTPFIILFGGTFFVYNFIGSLENDSIGIILLLISFIFYIRYKKYKDYQYLLLTITSIILSLNYWLWVGHLTHLPKLISIIAEEMFWVHWFSWLFLFYIIIFILIYSFKKKNYLLTTLTITILFYPKLFIFLVPSLLKYTDKLLDIIQKKPSYKFLFTIIVLGLIIGQSVSVGINTYNSWNRIVEDENCVLVNDEYFLRATKGLNYTYNQLNREGLKKCKQKT